MRNFQMPIVPITHERCDLIIKKTKNFKLSITMYWQSFKNMKSHIWYEMNNFLYLQGGPKKWHTFLYTLTSSNIDQCLTYFIVRIRRKFVILPPKVPITAQVCRYTTLWNVIVLKATTENKTTSVTTYFNMFIVSVIV